MSSPSLLLDRPVAPRQAVTPAKSAARPARDPWFDNAKFVLVALVVVGHSWTLLAKPPLDSAFYQFLYAWHMPAFVLVTGFLSRSFRLDARRISSLVRTVAAPYLLFELLLTTFRTQVGGESLHHLWLDPHWPMWFLCALFAWRIVTPLLMRVPAPVAVAGAVAVSLTVGYWGSTHFDLFRAAGMLPFYVIGLRVQRHHLAVLQRPAVRLAAAAALGSLLLVAVAYGDRLPTNWLYYAKPYAELHPLDGWTPVATRALVLAIGLVAALSALSLIPGRRRAISRLGAASLVVYLFHGFAILTAAYLGIGEWTGPHPWLGISVLTVCAITLATVLSLPAVAGRIGRLTDPIGVIASGLGLGVKVKRTADDCPDRPNAARPSATAARIGPGPAL